MWQVKNELFRPRTDAKVKAFEKLRKLRTFERQHLPLLQTLEDVDIVREIGFHQEAGMPVNLAALFRLEIGAAATVSRRLRRLKQLGLVLQRRSRDDGRMNVLTLSPAVLRVFAKYGRLLAAG